MAENLRFFHVARVNGVMQGLQDTRSIPAQLKFLRRTAVVPALDSEIMARFTGYLQIADLIANDQAAVVYSAGKYTFESSEPPNLKHGAAVNQEMLNQLWNLQNHVDNDATNIFNSYEERTVAGLLTGVEQRMEALIVAMKLDGQSYDRLGIKISGGWGMFPDLKVTVAVGWENAATATPVDNILASKQLAAERYGIEYDRIVLRTDALRRMIQTTEFQNKARLYLAPNVSFVNLNVSDIGSMRALASNVLGMTIETYDSRYWSQAANGSIASAPYLPINQVILESSADDNNAASTDFANGVVTESLVSRLAGDRSAVIGQFDGPTRGPVAYTTLANAQLNPPGLVYWGVARGFPRKHNLASNAVLTVGSFSETIPTTEPTF